MIDEDALAAALGLVGRAGAVAAEFGYLDEGVPAEEARWYAYAQYRGLRVQVPSSGPYFRGPVEALEALAARLLDGAMCRRCGRPIVLDDRAEGCRWSRQGKRWEPGCGLPIDFSRPAAPGSRG